MLLHMDSHMAACKQSTIRLLEQAFLDPFCKFTVSRGTLQVREDGKPACRTMGFAGFIKGTQQALLQTHAKYAFCTTLLVQQQLQYVVNACV